MRELLVILFCLISVSTLANPNEELLAQKGVSCLKDQYSIFDGNNLQNISDKVNCREKVSITKDNKISNLDCPDNTIFEAFLTSSPSSRKINTCLRSNRNNSPELFENVNCDCVEESLKNDYKDDFDKKTREFKDDLRARMQKNIGERIKKKVDYIRNSEILLSGNSARSCFDGGMFKHRFQRLTDLYNCGGNSKKAIERIQGIFGESFNISANPNSLDESIANLIKGIQDSTSSGSGIVSNTNSCFQDSKEMQRKYLAMKYDDRMVNLKASFGDFIKNRNLHSPTLHQDFNKYIKEKNIDLHPIIRSLAKNNLSSFLAEIDNDRSGKELTLNQLMNGSRKNEWLRNLALANRNTCISIADELAQTVCSEADIAYDDPSFIETFLDNNQDFKNKNLLNLKNLYCEKKDLHSIDAEGRLLVYKSKVNTNRAIPLDQDKRRDWDGIARNLFSGKPEEALKHLSSAVERGIGFYESDTHKQNTERIRRLDSIKGFMMASSHNLMHERGNQAQARRQSFITFFKGLEASKKALMDKQVNDIRLMGKDVYDIKKPNQSETQFTDRFVQNFKDRRYTRNLTDSLEGFHLEENKELKENSCQANFSNIYCSIKKNFEKSVDQNCIDKVGSLGIVDILNQKSPKNTFHNLCSAQTLMTADTVTTLRISMQEKIKSNPDICQEMAKSDYTTAYNQASSDESMAKAYFEEYTGGSLSSSFQGISDSENFIQVDSQGEDFIAPGDEQRKLNIVEDTSDKSLTTPMQPNNGNLFSDFNFFKDSKLSNLSKEEEIAKMNDKEFQKELKGKSNQELLDYIKQLESMIKEREDKANTISKDNQNSSILSPELEKLRKELAELKEKSELVQREIAKVDTPSDQAPATNNRTTQRSSFSNFKSSPSSKSELSKDSSEDQTESRIENESYSAQSNSVPNSSRIDNSSSGVSLTLNEQFDEILSKPNSNGQVEIVFNNETFTLEVKEDINGELVCKFADDELNNKKAEELDEICKKYVESLARLKNSKKIASDKKDKEKKKQASKPKVAKKKKIFKVEDLNKVLNN